MTSFLGRIFGHNGASNGDGAYEKAMTVSDDLITTMRDKSQSTDAVRAVMADIWRQNHNIPFVTTIIEAVEEMKSGIDQRPEDLRS